MEYSALKTPESVDNYLDIDEALHGYLVSFNASTPMQQGQGNSYPPESYQVNATGRAAFVPQFAAGVDPSYFAPSALASKLQSSPSEDSKPLPVPVRKSNVRTSASKLEQKHTQIQEKNRMAQKRFRERQKAKINELHQQIGNLEKRVEQLISENKTLQSHNGLLEKVLAMRDEHIKVMQQQQMDADQCEGEDTQLRRPLSIDLKAIKGKEFKFTTESLRKMTPEDAMQIWHAYVTEISSALVEYNSQTGGSTQRLEELIGEVSMVCMKLNVLNPMICKVWQAREYHTSEKEELKKWQSALGQLNMSEAQKSEMVQLRKLLLDKLQGLVEERKSLHTTIQTMLVTQTVSHKLALEYLKTNQTVMRLREILRRENNALLNFASTIVREVLRPEQVAAMMVHSYPQKPDLLALSSAVAVDAGEDVKFAPENNSGDIVSNLPEVMSTSTTSAPVLHSVCSIPSVGNSRVSHGEE